MEALLRGDRAMNVTTRRPLPLVAPSEPPQDEDEQARMMRLHRDEQRRMLAAKRRILERQVMDLLRGDDDKGELTGAGAAAATKGLENNARSSPPRDEDDGYEEICFKSPPPVRDDEKMMKKKKPDLIENHYLTPRVGPVTPAALMGKKSNSDSDLLMMDENKEIELLCGSAAAAAVQPKEATFQYAEPEQGFYRVYDDLDRVREWDLIPYVITRKMKEAEALLAKENLLAKEDEKEKKKTLAKGDVCSRVSLDSGRASVVSSVSNATTRTKRVHSDSGSNCSADSGTYNLFDDNCVAARGHFLKQVSLQLDSIRNHHHPQSKPTLSSSSPSLHQRGVHQPRSKRRVPPPPPSPPIKALNLPPPPSSSALSSLQPLNCFFSSSPSPPPLPPRLKCSPSSKQPAAPSSSQSATNNLLKRKDLSSYFGLLDDESNHPQSKEVAETVALQNLSDVIKENEPDLLQRTPPGKKDLSKYLGIQDSSPPPPPSSSLAITANSLLKRLSSSPMLQKSHHHHQRGHKPEQPVLAHSSSSSPSQQLPSKQSALLSSSSSAFKSLEQQPFVKSSSCRRELEFTEAKKATGENHLPHAPASSSSSSRHRNIDNANDDVFLGSSNANERGRVSKETTRQTTMTPLLLENKAVQTSVLLAAEEKDIKPGPVTSSEGATPKRSVTRNLFRTPLLKSGNNNGLRRRSSMQEDKRARKATDDSKTSSSTSASPYKLKNTPVRRFKSKEFTPRKSFMSSLLHSKRKEGLKGMEGDGAKRGEEREGEEKEEEVIGTTADRDYSQNVREALRQGLPVIPFLQDQCASLPPVFNVPTTTANYGQQKATAFLAKTQEGPSTPCKNAGAKTRENSENPAPKQHPADNTTCCHTDSSARTFCKSQENKENMVQASPKLSSQQSSLYLTMNPGVVIPPSSLTVQALATPAGSMRYQHRRGRSLSLWPPPPQGGAAAVVAAPKAAQHCQSCTCNKHGGGGQTQHEALDLSMPKTAAAAAKGGYVPTELDYVRMENYCNRQRGHGLIRQRRDLSAATKTMHF